MEGLFAAMITLSIFIFIIFTPIVREHNKRVKSELGFYCECGYQADYQEYLDNHLMLTNHKRQMLENEK